MKRTSRIDKVLDQKFVLKPWENYRGISYGELLVRWSNWLVSDNPDKYVDTDMLYLRGNLGYQDNQNTFYSRSNVQIREGTAILVPIVTTLYSFGDSYDGQLISDEFYLRKAVREHVDAAGPFWATIEGASHQSGSPKKLVPNLSLYRMESPLFQLNISKLNPFLNKLDEPMYPGTHTSLASGYFILLRDLIPSKYAIRFGGKGMGNFFTDALYEIVITKKDKIRKDISGQNKTPSALLKEKRIEIKDV
jgi:hypothetical protein